MPPAQAGTSALAGIASHAISEANGLQANLEAQSQKLIAWQEQVAAAEARAASAESAHEAAAAQEAQEAKQAGCDGTRPTTSVWR